MHFDVLAQTLIGRFDGWQRRHRWPSFIFALLKKYSEDDGAHKAVLLTYYGFLSIFPFLLVLTTVFRLVLNGNEQMANRIIHSAATYFPGINNSLVQNIHGYDRSGLALIIGVALTLFGSRGVADTMRFILDTLWVVPRWRRSEFFPALGKSIGIIIIGGLGFALAPVIAGFAFIFAHGLVFRVGSALIATSIIFLVISLIMELALSVRRPFKDIWLSAASAAIGLEILQILGGYIVGRELQNLNSLYGLFALILGLLYWLYLQAQILVFTFEIDTVRVLQLSPRSVVLPLLPADQRAHELYEKRAQYSTNSEN